MGSLIHEVKEFARQSHGDQQRKFADEPYINHPIRVMETCMIYTSNDAILMAALLHDVLEDTDVTKSQLADFLLTSAGKQLSGETVSLVVELTDIYTKKSYPQWNRRKRKNMEANRLKQSSGDAQTIKYADILDNSLELAGAEPDFARLYLSESRSLLKLMTKGHPDLHARAVKTISEELSKL